MFFLSDLFGMTIFSNWRIDKAYVLKRMRKTVIFIGCSQWQRILPTPFAKYSLDPSSYTWNLGKIGWWFASDMLVTVGARFGWLCNPSMWRHESMPIGHEWFTCLEAFSMFQASLLMFSIVSDEFDLEHCSAILSFLDAQNRSIYLFRFAPWRVEAKLKPSPLSSAWIAKYRSRSGLWP